MLGVGLALAGVVAALYGRAVAYPFVYDDQALIVGNVALQDLATLPCSA